MSSEEMKLTGVVIGNVIITEAPEQNSLLVYRQQPSPDGGEPSNVLIAAFLSTEAGVVISTLFAAYLAEMFSDGDITQQAVMDKLINSDTPPSELCVEAFKGYADKKTEKSESTAEIILAEVKARYIQLISAVGKKFPGESRHETALRYIHQAELVEVSAPNKNIDSV